MATAERRGAVPAALAKLTIRGLSTRAVRVPMRLPLRTSGGSITQAPLVLIELDTDEGVPGRAYLFAYSELGARTLRQLLAGISEMVRGDAVAPVAIAKKLYSRFTLIGREGLPTIAMSGLDVALWDALARATGLPLARLLGGEVHPVPAYNSNALGLDPPERVAEEALELLAEGFRAVKLRLGRKTLWDDVLATRAVRGRIPAEALLMTDFNQALTVADGLAEGGGAGRRGRNRDVLAPLSRGERAAARRHAVGPLPGVRRLGGAHPRAAAPAQGRTGAARRVSGCRPRLERRGGRPFRSRMSDLSSPDG